jgi:hypothetical protein
LRRPDFQHHLDVGAASDISRHNLNAAVAIPSSLWGVWFCNQLAIAARYGDQLHRFPGARWSETAAIAIRPVPPAASNEQHQHGLTARRLLDGSAEKSIYLTSSYQKRF